jgi:hypothetical protein
VGAAIIFFTGAFFKDIYVLYSTLFHLPPSDSTVSDDAEIEPFLA